MVKRLVHALRIFICIVLIVQLTGCGTILYPERKGQKNGKIDAGVAILDGIGILLYIIPGVIAFAVDFYNGTIYLPGTMGARSTEQDIKLTVQNAGQVLKSAGRNAADSIRHAVQ
jgi:hypothetical protein